MASPDDVLDIPDITIKSHHPCPVCQSHEWFPYECIEDPGEEAYFAPCSCCNTSAIVDREDFFMGFAGMDVCKWCLTAITCFVDQ